MPLHTCISHWCKLKHKRRVLKFDLTLYLLCWLLNVPLPIRAKLRLDCRISVVANPPSSGSNGSSAVDIDWEGDFFKSTKYHQVFLTNGTLFNHHFDVLSYFINTQMVALKENKKQKQKTLSVKCDSWYLCILNSRIYCSIATIYIITCTQLFTNNRILQLIFFSLSP
jgi:hypothetical protein